jgi:hypothetical protein
MDGKSRILIVSFLGHIQIASKKKHRKAGGRAVIHYLMGWNDRWQKPPASSVHWQHLVL